MNFHDLVPGWRGALLGAIVLLAVYVAFVFFRLRRLRRKPETAPASAQQPREPADDTRAPSGEEPSTAPPPAAGERAAAAYAEQAFPWNEAPDGPSGDVRLATLEGEVHRLRRELGTVRGELASVSGELSTLRAELRRELERVDEHVQAAQHVAPIYGEAMHMALSGHDASSIAERCGVARAEAELVVALIRNRDAGPADELMMKER